MKPREPRKRAYPIAVLLLGAILIAAGFFKRGAIDSASRYPRPARSLAWVQEYRYRADQVYDFAFGRGGIYVPIVVARADDRDVHLIFDTGSNDYASLDEKLIRTMKLPVKRWTDWLDASGNIVSKMPIAQLETLDFGPLHLRDIEVGGMGPESIMGKRNGVQGTLGWQGLRNYRVTLDYSNEKIALSASGLPPVIGNCPTRYVTRFLSPPHLDGLILVEGKLAQKEIYIQVDTGKSSTVVDPKAKSVREFEQGRWGYIVEGITLGPFAVQSRWGRMGGLEDFSRGLNKPVYIGVGSDFLAEFLITIDYPNRTLVLEKRPCES